LFIMHLTSQDRYNLQDIHSLDFEVFFVTFGDDSVIN
jgi:hypothetical protein